MDNALCNRLVVDRSACKPISTLDDLVTSNQNEINSFGISGLETNRGASCDVKAVSMRSDAIKIEIWISLNEMVV